MKYSGPLRRLTAFAIDCVVMLGLYMFLGLVLGLSIFAHPISALPMIGFWFYGGLFVCAWLYFASFESSEWQATVGKRLLGLKVVDLDGERVSFLRATVRYFSKLLSRLIMMIGFLMVLWTKKKQALHDKIASTLIIYS